MDDLPTTFDALISKWGIAQFAADIGVTYSTANAMKQRKSVPARYWPQLVAKGAERDIPLTPDHLIAMEARKTRKAA